jgi:hypothetical protein
LNAVAWVNVLEAAKRFFGSLAPSVTKDEEGKPVLTFGISKNVKSGRRWMKCWKSS